MVEQYEETVDDENEDPYIRNLRRASRQRPVVRVQLDPIPEELDQGFDQRPHRITSLLDFQQTESLAQMLSTVQQDDLNQMRRRIADRPFRNDFMNDPILSQGSQAVFEI